MDVIEVVAHFDPTGRVRPERFIWQGRAYQLESTGRRWEADDGLHILVMIPGGRVFELLFSPAESRWYLRPTGTGRTVA